MSTSHPVRYLSLRKNYFPPLSSPVCGSLTCNTVRERVFLTLLVAKVSREIEIDRDIQRERARKRDREGKERGEE